MGRLEAKGAVNSMLQHFKGLYRLNSVKLGRPAKVRNIAAEDSRPVFCEDYCQRFFISGA
jgi:hypothetical protein